MKFFWPIYLATAVASTAGVYFAAPLARPFVKALRSEQPSPDNVAQAPVPQPGAPERRPFVPGEEPAPAEPPEPAAAAQEADETLPAMMGIFLASSGDKPEWGITHQLTTYYTPAGERQGQVPGGLLFEYKGRTATSKGAMLSCVFVRDGATKGPYLISAKDALLYVGSYKRLSERQMAAIKAYYELSGKIGARKTELLQQSAAKNPFFAQYQAAHKALMDHIDTAKALTAQRDKATEAEKSRLEERLREMKMEDTKLRATYNAEHLKFRGWKDQHAKELVRPENDPSIQRWTQEMAALRSRVPGLLF